MHQAASMASVMVRSGRRAGGSRHPGVRPPSMYCLPRYVYVAAPSKKKGMCTLVTATQHVWGHRAAMKPWGRGQGYEARGGDQAQRRSWEGASSLP